MDIKKLASLIAKAEGKKSAVKIGDVREILRILVEMEYASGLPGSKICSPVICIDNQVEKMWKAAKPEKMIKKKGK